MNGVLYYTAQEVADMLGISRAQSYRVIKLLNEELAKKGFLVFSGKVSKKYFSERDYGGTTVKGGEE